MYYSATCSASPPTATTVSAGDLLKIEDIRGTGKDDDHNTQDE